MQIMHSLSEFKTTFLLIIRYLFICVVDQSTTCWEGYQQNKWGATKWKWAMQEVKLVLLKIKGKNSVSTKISLQRSYYHIWPFFTLCTEIIVNISFKKLHQRSKACYYFKIKLENLLLMKNIKYICKNIFLK